MDERLKFVARLLDGEKMAVLCREFGISRPTGYKIFQRYKDFGVQGLDDQSRRPYRHANQLPFQIERTILRIKKDHSSWGAPKIRETLLREFPMVKPPAKSTVHAVLDRHGLIKRRKRRRYKAEGTPLKEAYAPNQLWCTDYKGEFKLGNRQYCYPLTITDYSSRYLLACEGLESTRSLFAFAVFERVFKEFGLPKAIQDTDVLEAIPVGCRGGGCGVCRIKVVQGSYEAKKMSRKHVTEEEQAEAIVLACRVFPRGDLLVDVLPVSNSA